MKTKPFFCLLIVCMLPMLACGLFQPGYTATRTALAQTTVAASWTDTPTPTSTATLTPTPTATETFTPTPDPCLPENLPDAVNEVQKLMLRFEALSIEAANAQREDLPDKIAGLQSLLQTAEEQKVAPCLQTLKDHQLKHMNLVIDTLDAFKDGVDQKIVNEMLQQARDEHDAYVLELSRLLKIDIYTITPTP
ncbi:MAG TPA: hypothetical protein VLE49_08870 [Anaerolineales bacterium]|nr:hypothetical protein [Anaerolineales bacterium]